MMKMMNILIIIATQFKHNIITFIISMDVPKSPKKGYYLLEK